jgi:hypothetical protein
LAKFRIIFNRQAYFNHTQITRQPSKTGLNTYIKSTLISFKPKYHKAKYDKKYLRQRSPDPGC